MGSTFFIALYLSLLPTIFQCAYTKLAMVFVPVFNVPLVKLQSANKIPVKISTINENLILICSSLIVC